MRQIATLGLLVCASALALAGCTTSSTSRSGGGGGPIPAGASTDSRIVVLGANATVPDVGIDKNNSTTVTSQTTLGVFAYQIGPVAGQNAYLGVAGVAPSALVGGAPTTASATYRGTYSLSYADRTEFNGPVSGNITLNADFANQRLTGQSGDLSVDGRLAGQTIGGTASYRGVDADLNGRIGDVGAIGAFAGDTNDAVLVGGFSAFRN
ncbi:MAG: hypothetical protein AAFQ79_09720 [Pseudomonadota bacterium]